jgi:glycerol-1-phosphate dehydrogenase [NAD(P)+]
MNSPQVIVFNDGTGEDGAAAALRRYVAELGISRPLVLASPFGRRLAGGLGSGLPHETAAANANQEWTAALGLRARRGGADAIVAIGGGRCLDVAKLAAARAGVIVVAVPTQLSHDGICSPVAVVPNSEDRRESLGAIAPRAVFLSVPTLLLSPPESVAAGLGDLLANPLALRDWALAAEHGLEKVDSEAWDMSARSFELVADLLERDVSDTARDPDALLRLADALVLSGLSMLRAGSSRPASGGEHEISHAVDYLFGERAMHGAQVAFGCIVSSTLYEEDTDGLKDVIERLGLPVHPAQLGLSVDDMTRVLLSAPDMRPGRFTILEDADLDDGMARALIKRIWNEPR